MSEIDRRQIMGRIHSTDSFGAVDGPGVRFVVFLQGCHLRCLYCHNPDTWDTKGGREASVGEIADEIKSLRSFIQGVTITGGEPMLQAYFVLALTQELQELGLHVAIDSNGFVRTQESLEAYKTADLILLDLKAFSLEKHKALTGVSNLGILEMAQLLSSMGKKMWIRYVLVPGWTDDLPEVRKMADFLKGLETVEKVEVLPFHKMGEFKWAELGLDYQLTDTESPTSESLQTVINIFRNAGFDVH